MRSCQSPYSFHCPLLPPISFVPSQAVIPLTLLPAALAFQIRELVNFLPQSNKVPPPIRETRDEADRLSPALNTIVPADSKLAYVPGHVPPTSPHCFASPRPTLLCTILPCL